MQDVQTLIHESRQLEQAQQFGEALNLLNQARRSYPGSRPLALRLGEFLERIKRYDAALELYDNMIEAADGSVEPAVTLGRARALFAVAKVREAAEIFDSLPDVLPDEPDVYTGMAGVRRELGNIQDAKLFVGRALMLAPGDQRAVHELARIQLAAGDKENAIKTLEGNCIREDQFGDSLDLWLDTLRDLRRERYIQEKLEYAAKQWPHKVEFIFGLGVQAHKAGEVSKARPALEQADRLSPNNHRILHEWGVMERVAGNLEFSQQLLARSLDLNPEQPATLRVYGTEHKFQYGDKEFTRLNYAAARIAESEPMEQVHFHYALGKAYEDVTELDTAFRHYEAAGQKKRKSERYDERGTSMMFNVLPQVVNAKALEAYRETGCQSDVPVFILGMPRSGTSLIEQILSSHPDIFGAGELKFVPPAVDNIRYGNNRLNINEPEPAFPSEANASWLARGEWYLEKVMALADKPYKRIVDKMPGNFSMVPLISAMLPNAKIIHSRRHPVETCLSNYRIHFAEGQLWSYNLRELGRYYRRYWQLMKFWREQFPGVMYEVRYEDNVADVEGQARKLIDYLELPWNEGVLKFYDTDRPVRTASATQVRKPIYKSSTNRWRKFEKYLGPLLEELGDVVPEYEAEIAHLNG